jgi:hypothetical protein
MEGGPTNKEEEWLRRRHLGIKCDYLVPAPFRGRMRRSRGGRWYNKWAYEYSNKSRKIDSYTAAEAYRTPEYPKQLTFQLISLNPLQNKLKLPHWKERHRLMGVRVKRGGRADIRTLIHSEGT